MAVDALVKANGYLKISSYPFDPAEYWKVLLLLKDIYFFLYYQMHFTCLSFMWQLDDTILKTIEFADSKKLKESKEIIQRIRRRDLYQATVYLCIQSFVLLMSEFCFASFFLHDVGMHLVDGAFILSVDWQFEVENFIHLYQI